LPAPFASPPFPSAEYQGYPLIGVPASDSTYTLMKAINAGPHADFFKDNKINLDGWVNASANWSNARNSNSPPPSEIVGLTSLFPRKSPPNPTQHRNLR